MNLKEKLTKYKEYKRNKKLFKKLNARLLFWRGKYVLKFYNKEKHNDSLTNIYRYTIKANNLETIISAYKNIRGVNIYEY